MNEITRRDFLKLSGLTLCALLIPKKSLHFEPECVKTNSDVLNFQTQEKLSAKASTLISPSPESAIKTADMLMESSQGSINSICGPLAINQLLHTVISGVKPSDYLQSSPEGKNANPNLFSQAFPKNKFDSYRINTSIASYDFDLINLQPGDFIYFFGHDVNTNHMITVSRRDSNGILHCVTNYPQANGQFIIKEVPLWNPKDKNTSFIKKFAKNDNPVQFSTGEDGFMLWRLKEKQPSAFDNFEHTEAANNLQFEIEDIVNKSRGDWHVLINNLNSNKIIAEFGSRIPHHSASVIKVPISMAVMSQLESEVSNEQDLNNILMNRGYKGRSFNQLLSAMLVFSEEEATASLIDYILFKGQNTSDLIASWGADSTVFSSRYSTAEDTKQFFSHIYDFKTFKYSLSHKYLLDLLSRKTESDLTRLGTLPNFGVNIDQIYNKRGSIAKGITVVADSGIVRINTSDNKLGKKSFFISLTGRPRQNIEVTYDTLEVELLSFVQAFAKFCMFSQKKENLNIKYI